MKKKILAVFCMCVCLMGGSLTVLAENNHQDTRLPSSFISYTTSCKTANRNKTDSSSVYIQNTCGMNLKVYVKSAGNVNCTYKGSATVKSGKWLLHNTVYEKGYKTCHLQISTANSSVSGKLSGNWSPDSVGSYSYANPF